MLIRLVFVFVVLLLTGCVSVVLPKRDSAPQYQTPTKLDIPNFFDIPRQPAQIKCLKIKDAGLYKTCKFAVHSWRKSGLDRNDIIKGIIYIPKIPKASDGFLVLPGAGENISSRAIAKTLANSGFYTVRIYSGFKPLQNKTVREAANKETAEAAIELMANDFRQAIRQRVVDLMRIADFVEQNYGVKKIHTIGISLGGGIGSLFTAIDPRGEGLMTLMSSANTARLLIDAASRENVPNKQLQEIGHLIYDGFGLTYEQAYGLLKKELEIVEPMTYKDRLSRDKILMVSGAFDMLGLIDAIIPYSATKETWEAYEKPEWVILATGHVTSAVALSPFWLELPYLHHVFYTTYQSYLSHLIKDHFLPLALR